MKLNCCLIFDIGKTNQKYFVFDKNYKILSRAKITIPKIKDEDGHTAEDIAAAFREIGIWRGEIL